MSENILTGILTIRVKKYNTEEERQEGRKRGGRMPGVNTQGHIANRLCGCAAVGVRPQAHSGVTSLSTL